MILDALLPPLFGIAGLVVAFVIYTIMVRQSEGDEKIRKIGDAIHEGAMVFMNTEYSRLAMFAIPLGIILYFALGINTAISFAVGALASGLAGYLGMFSATKANVRTTTAAQSEGQAGALTIAFYGGSIMGLCVASLGLVGLGFLYWLFGSDPEAAHAIHGFGMGASSVALFSRVGGGIYTKCADVGADLVGKVEAGIPEDDPRNPGVIADNVGDNVGDVAGMGSDIFESYCGSMIATVAIASTMVMSDPSASALLAGAAGEQAKANLMAFPLILASLGLVCSVIGIFVVRMRSNAAPEQALRNGHQLSAILLMAAAMSRIADNWCPFRSACSGAALERMRTTKIPITEQTKPREARIKGNAMRLAFACSPAAPASRALALGSDMTIVDAIATVAIMEPQ